MRIVGDLTSKGEIQLDGTVEGNIKAKFVGVRETGHVKGHVDTNFIEVAGRVTGQIKARFAKLVKTAHVAGDILHEDLAIERGAFIEGHCKRLEFKPEEDDSAAAAAGNGSEKDRA